MNDFGTGALPSKKDKRTVKNEELAFIGIPLVKGGREYLPKDIEHQHKVGICTAISLIQLRQKQTGKQYSPEWQYLCQKKLYDGNWYEGSSIFSALKVAKNIGFLPAKEWTWTDEQDRYLPYANYISKLKIPDTEFERLRRLCVDKIAGYASVDVNDSQAMAKAINESEAGILCRYECGSTWWLPSWKPSDINPLRKPNPATSGHAIDMIGFNYSLCSSQKLANTWGTKWCMQGQADIIHSMYAPTESWTILRENPMFKFTKTLYFGMRNPEVKKLQKRLNMPTWLNTGYFWLITRKYVKNYQRSKGLVADGIVGSRTRASLNQ